MAAVSTSRRNRIYLTVGVASAILVAAVASVMGLAFQRQMVETRTNITTQNLARSLELSIDGKIDKIDIALQACADEINRQIATGHPNVESITEVLVRQSSRLPGVAYVRATNERGDVVYGAGVVSPPVNQADRRFFIAPRDNPSVGLYVEKPLFARINQTWVWPFSRRINKADGSFAGVVFASFVLDQFEAQLAQLELGNEGRIAVRDADLGLIASYPSVSSVKIPVGNNRVSANFRAALNSNPMEGTYIAGVDSVDGIRRTLSYRRSAKYGYLVNVGISRETALTEWNKQALLIGGLMTTLFAVLLVTDRLIRRSWRRQEQDMAALQASQQELAKAKDAAEAANQAKSEFLSSMSHELRTPMNAILGFSQLMALDANLAQEHQDGAHEILSAGQHLLALIDQVLDLAKIESGRFDLSTEHVEVSLLVSECLVLVAPLANKCSIHLNSDRLDGLIVRADRVRFKQALLNLLSNAIKYNRAGGSVKIDAQPQGDDRLRIRVVDSGPGISAERLKDLFQPFNRLGAENSVIEGTGIGLTITRRIVEMMGGTVDVESEVGVGSTFWIELPLDAARGSGTEPRNTAEA